MQSVCCLVINSFLNCNSIFILNTIFQLNPEAIRQMVVAATTDTTCLVVT